MDDKTILLVDDDPRDIELMLLALRKSGANARVHIANGGAQALELLSAGARPELPAVVLLDLNMPMIGGVEVLRRLRADDRTRCLPVVILTSSGEDEDRRTAYRLGANSYVRKPSDFTQFVQAADQLARYWVTLNAPPPN